ncbi:MAG: hypothetical protein ACI9OJ_002166 [Myxococcota bacterium]|jgi:hypothetical protein
MPHRLEKLAALLGAFGTRLLLSVAIVVSIIVQDLPVWAQWAFLILFSGEVVARSVLMAWKVRNGRTDLGGIIVLLVDVLATLSFVPFAAAGSDLLRFGRIARLVLLLTYWGPLARDFVRIALQRERLSQLMLVAGLATVLVGAGASVLRLIDTTGLDVDGSGSQPGVGAPRPNFVQLLWWAVRQVWDPGNLVPSADNASLALVSLVLTAGGLLLIAVIIGIGATLVEDLVRVGRTRPVNLYGHMVVLNVGDDARGVLLNIRSYFKKQLGRRAVAVQGTGEERPAFLDEEAFRGFVYRRGSPAERSALELLDVGNARRIAILSPGEGAAADAEAVTAVMSARMLNEDAWIVVELNRPSNISAALNAGRARTIPVPARRLAALVLAQELVDPGRARLLLSLVSLEGHELYTCIFADGRVRDLDATLTLDRPFDVLRRQVMEEHRVLLLGYFVDNDDDHRTWLRGMREVLNPPAGVIPPPIRGVFALATRFNDLEDAVRAIHRRDLSDVAPPIACPAPPLTPDVPLSPRRVIVLGFHADTVETVGELLRTFPRCEVTIVGADEAERNRMRASFLGERTETGATFSAPNKKKLVVNQRDGTVCGVINIRVADRYAEGMYIPDDRSGPVGSVFDYDGAIVLAERDGRAHPDAATVLAILKMADNWNHNKRLQLVVAELTDSDKTQLLRARVSELELDAHCTFVCTSELRQDILNHSFFVPGLPPVLHDLMTAGDQEIFAFHSQGGGSPMTFGDLVSQLQVGSPPLVPLGVLGLDGHLLVNPPPDHMLHWADIRTVYCLGTAA